MWFRHPRKSYLITVDFFLQGEWLRADREGGLGHADRKNSGSCQLYDPLPERPLAIVARPVLARRLCVQLNCPVLGLDAGRITVGGKDVRDFKLDSLMKNISMVFQNVSVCRFY